MAEEADDQAIFDAVTDRSAAPEVASPEPAVAEVAEKTEGTERDEHGRFAPKAAAEPEPKAPEPETTTQAEPEQAGMVPQQALHETRQQLKEERERREALERRFAAIEQANRAPAKAPEPPRVPEPWDPDYNDYQRNQVETAVQRQKMATSQLLAVDKFGPDVVSAAETALQAAVQADPSVLNDVRRILASPHPYAETVAWHKAKQARERVGNDPDAFVKAELDKMLADPAQRAALQARLSGAPAAVETGPANVTPLATRLPPSLSRISAAAGGAQPGADVSDAELFAQVTRR